MVNVWLFTSPMGASGNVPSQNLTWNLKMAPWIRRFLLETIIFRFHVKLQVGIQIWLKECSQTYGRFPSWFVKLKDAQNSSKSSSRGGMTEPPIHISWGTTAFLRVPFTHSQSIFTFGMTGGFGDVFARVIWKNMLTKFGGIKEVTVYAKLGGGFKYFLFSPLWGRFPFWLIFFQLGWNHQSENMHFGEFSTYLETVNWSDTKKLEG